MIGTYILQYISFSVLSVTENLIISLRRIFSENTFSICKNAMIFSHRILKDTICLRYS